jgi:hypothetical protein
MTELGVSHAALSRLGLDVHLSWSRSQLDQCLLCLQMGSLAVSATWGLLLYVCTRFSWAHYDTGKQEVRHGICAGMTCASSCYMVLACTQLI